MQSPEVDVVIVTWNTKEMTCACVEAVQCAIAAEKIWASICVVDNDSSDGTVEALRQRFTGITVVAHTCNAGFSIANNIGIRQSSAPYVLLLNSDAFPHENCLTTLLNAIRGNATIGAVGPRLILRSGKVQSSVTSITSPLLQLGYLMTFYFPPLDHLFKPFFKRRRASMVAGRHTRQVQLLSAACLLVRRSVFDRVGLLPEDRFLYSEEDDFFFRLRRADIGSLYVPSAVATHLLGASTSTRKSGNLTDEHFIRSRLRFLFTHYPRRRRATYIMHRCFFSWCQLTSQLKARIRRREIDREYLDGYRRLVDIAKEEYRRVSRVLPDGVK